MDVATNNSVNNEKQMDITKYIITSVLKEDVRKTSVNSYNQFISVPQQQVLSTLKNIEAITFKILRMLVEINGGYLKLKNNIYHNIKKDTIVILKNKEANRSAAADHVMLEKLQEEYPDVSRIAIVVINASDEKMILPASDNGSNEIQLYYGGRSFSYLFGDREGYKIKMTIKEEIRDYMFKLANEFISTFP